MLVTATVLNNGKYNSEVHAENIDVILVTDTVLNNGTDCNDGQPENIDDILLTEDVLNNGTDCNAWQLLNIDTVLSLAPPFNIVALSNIDERVNVPADENPNVEAALQEQVISSQFDA